MIAIRKADPKDVKRISYLIRNNLEKLNLNNYSETQVNTWKAANSPSKILKQFEVRDLFCAFEHNKMVGTIGLESMMVVGLYVAYTQLGRGVATQLLKHVEDYARQEGRSQLQLFATPSGKGFYSKHGFLALREENVIINGIDYPETFMEKYL